MGSMLSSPVYPSISGAKNIKPISWSLVFNFFLSPLVGYLLVLLALRHYPGFAVALLLLAVTPCAGMVVGWTGFAKGNVALALALAARFFSPLTVVMLAINPLIQMPAMALFLRWSPRLVKVEKGSP